MFKFVSLRQGFEAVERTHLHEAAHDMMDWVRTTMATDGMSWQELETMIWIEGDPAELPLDTGAEPLDRLAEIVVRSKGHGHANFYAIRDHCCDQEWINEKGEWVGP